MVSKHWLTYQSIYRSIDSSMRHSIGLSMNGWGAQSFRGSIDKLLNLVICHKINRLLDQTIIFDEWKTSLVCAHACPRVEKTWIQVGPRSIKSFALIIFPLNELGLVTSINVMSYVSNFTIEGMRMYEKPLYNRPQMSRQRVTDDISNGFI